MLLCGALVVLAACAGDPSDVPVVVGRTGRGAGAEAVATSTTGAPGRRPAQPATTPEPLTTIVGGGLPPELAVAVEYVPNLALLRSLEVQITNAGPSDVTVAELAYDSPFVDPARRRPTSPSSVPAWSATSRCRSARRPARRGDGPSLVTVTVTIDGQPVTGSYPILEPERLQQLNERECGQRAVLERAELALGDAPTTVGEVLTTTIDMTRRSGTEPITITETGSTLLFQVLPQGPRARWRRWRRPARPSPCRSRCATRAATPTSCRRASSRTASRSGCRSVTPSRST